MICKHCANEAEIVISREGFWNNHLKNVTVYYGKPMKYEQVKPGQIFSYKGTKYLKIFHNEIAIRIPDFVPYSEFSNYDDVYMLGDIHLAGE